MSSEAASGALAVIPARAGSKRLPGKNLKDLGGKPLIVWTIEAALASPGVAEVWVSTDSGEIASVAHAAGARVPFLRPPELATDSASSLDVVLHALDRAREGRGADFPEVVLLQPTSPLRNAGDVTAALALLRGKSADAVVSVCPADHSPLWMNVLPPDGSLQGFLRPEVKNLRSQDLPAYYRLNGAIYALRTEALRRERTFIPDRGAYAYIMPRERSVDIDDAMDLALAGIYLDPGRA
jgi:N-acylneuraminate cytidylyltransferase